MDQEKLYELARVISSIIGSDEIPSYAELDNNPDYYDLYVHMAEVRSDLENLGYYY